MPPSPLSAVVRHIRALAERAPGAMPTDRHLLERFIQQRDEAAFALLVRRHGVMVLSVARRILQDAHAAEDVFQNTFLTLARRAASIRKRDALAIWLYSVAARLAMQARVQEARRKKHERATASPLSEDVVQAAAWRELGAVLDEELQRLPEKYRMPLVLIYFAGQTQETAARQLDWSFGTLRRRLEHGKRLLHDRLLRRGVSLSLGLLTTAIAQNAIEAALPALLVQRTVQEAVRMAAAQATGWLFGTVLLTRAKVALMLGLLFTAGTGLALISMAFRQPVEAKEQEASQPREAPQRPVKQKQDPIKLARKMADTIQDPVKKARALLVIAEVQTMAGDKDTALQTIQDAVEVANTLPEDRFTSVEERCELLMKAAHEQTRAGDLGAATRTTDAIRVPKDKFTDKDLDWIRDFAHLSLAMAQAQMGKLNEAAMTADRIGNNFGNVKPQAFLAIVDAQGGVRDWKAARETGGRLRGGEWFQGLAVVARRQAEAGLPVEADKTLKEALQAAKSLAKEQDRDEALYRIALAQADIGDLQGASLTAESISGKQVREFTNESNTFPFKERILVKLRTRLGDFKGARTAADAIDTTFLEGYEKGDALRMIACGQAQAELVKEALSTTAAIQHVFLKSAAYIDVGRELAQAGNRAGATEAFGRELELIQAVPEGKQLYLFERYFYFDDALCCLLRTLAAAQEESRQDAAARDWIAKLGSPHLKVWALAGLSEGAIKKAK